VGARRPRRHGPRPQFTADATTAILGAAAECPSLERIVVRSGIEIYGRNRHSLTRPDESVAPDPTSEYGRMVERIESVAEAVARRIGVAVGALRLAPVLGPHVPSPLGRLLRQPVVPFSILADPPFAVVEDADAARAFVRRRTARHRSAQRRRAGRDHRPPGRAARQADPPAARRPRVVDHALSSRTSGAHRSPST
jgi:nucleoside-diphosphate-sugar epimerase